MEYMVLIGYWIDSTWRLHRCILNFVLLPPPWTGIAIADDIFKCLMGWGIKNKVYTISVDNASSNDVTIKVLKENFEVSGKLLCRGKLFHVRCCAHILNLIVQDGLYQIRHIIDDIHESVLYINSSESRLKVFFEIVQQLKLPYQKLILHCKIRWNSTYEILATAIRFKKVFPRLKERDINYHNNPSDEDWEKVEKVYDILKVSNGSTKLISRSNYPTSNLFLKEVCVVRCILDSKSESEDDFIRVMVRKMKEKSTGKYDDLWDALYELYGEYVQANQGVTIARASTSEGHGHEAIEKEDYLEIQLHVLSGDRSQRLVDSPVSYWLWSRILQEEWGYNGL
ncbi:zinc finger BED domain-containing protein RICESLEEPER 2-like [Pistacia vera]|uniref:zinc finger BED domain-containing protein RICESLEEPER 2-like n=1 Tax=Pistacia vera TaxID=55513 RepID=UPI00126369DD|nr:zinc finger BED domain-containing protein RICESLEEPER 2-like [Pistacia vera]